MSQAKSPTLCFALPFYRRIQEHLDESAALPSTTTVAGMGAAIVAGLQKLNQYYVKAQVNESNIIATGKMLLWPHRHRLTFPFPTLACHPSFRLDWFHKLGSDMYTRACKVVKAKFDEYKTRQKVTEPKSATAPSTQVPSQLSQLELALGSPVKKASTSSEGPDVVDVEWTRWCAGDGAWDDAPDAGRGGALAGGHGRIGGYCIRNCGTRLGHSGSSSQGDRPAG